MRLTDVNMEAVLGSFVPTRLHLRLSGKEQDYLPQTGPPNARAEATLVHEQLHFFQTLMTGYGQISWQLHRQATIYAYNSWKALTADSPLDRRLPLGYLAKIDSQRFIGSYLTGKTVFEIVSLAQARFARRPGIERVDQLGLMTAKEPWDLHPQVSIGGRPRILEGRDILEGHAIFLEAIYSYFQNEVPIENTIDPKLVSERYTSAFQWFEETVGPGRQLEFLVVCDLALQTLWDDPPKTERSWRASSPAWRFVALTRALAEAGDRCRIGEPGEVPETYNPFSSTLLEACEFASLEQVLDQRLRNYQNRQLLRFEIMMRDALEYRKRVPWCAANPFVDTNLWIDMKDRFPPPLIQVGGELRVSTGGAHAAVASAGDTALLDEAIIELQFQAFVLQVLGSFSDRSRAKGEMECAYGLFEVPAGCHYQVNNGCPASFIPRQGTPFPVVISGGDMSGCPFGIVLAADGISVTNLDLAHGHDLPTDDDLEEAERRARSLR